jgi:hypothetical protein
MRAIERELAHLKLEVCGGTFETGEDSTRVHIELRSGRQVSGFILRLSRRHTWRKAALCGVSCSRRHR